MSIDRDQPEGYSPKPLRVLYIETNPHPRLRGVIHRQERGRTLLLQPFITGVIIIAAGALLLTTLGDPSLLDKQAQVQANISNSAPRVAQATAVSNEQALKDAKQLEEIASYLESRLKAGVNNLERAKNTRWTAFLAPIGTYQTVRQETTLGITVRDFPSEREGDTVLYGGTKNDPAIKTWTWGSKVAGGPYEAYVREENDVLGEENYWSVRFTGQGGDPYKPQPHLEAWRAYARTPNIWLDREDLVDFYQDQERTKRIGSAAIFLQPRASREISNPHYLSK